MQSEGQIRGKNDGKKTFRTLKSGSNRSPCGGSQPFSYEHLLAKQKAYERYKKIYPVNEKENLYPLEKTPNIGYYVMKGYRQEGGRLREGGGLRESERSSCSQQVKSSEKIISNMLKKYLCRKEEAQVRTNQTLPRLEQLGLVGHPTNRSAYPGVRRGTRVWTEYEERRGPESGLGDRG